METARTSRTSATSASADGASTPTTAPVAPAPATESGTPTRSRRPFLILAAVLVVAGAAVGAYRHMTAGQESTDDAQIGADTVPIATRVGGVVAHVTFHEDQLVKKGELLAQIDDTDYQARVRQAEAEVATTRAQAATAEAEAQIVEATSRGGLDVARAALRGSSVGVSSAAAQVALATEAKSAAESHVGEARGRLSQSTPIAPQIAAAKAGVDLAYARVRGAEAALALARLQLDYTRIVAPADGIASKLMVHEGQLAAAGQPVAALVPSATYVIANFKETQIGRMRVGQRAEIVLDAFPGKTFEGTVASLSGGTGSSFSLLPADNATGNFVKVVQRVPVRVAWKTPPSGTIMRAGLSADVTVFVEQ